MVYNMCICGKRRDHNRSKSSARYSRLVTFPPCTPPDERGDSRACAEQQQKRIQPDLCGVHQNTIAKSTVSADGDADCGALHLYDIQCHRKCNRRGVFTLACCCLGGVMIRRVLESMK